MQMFSCKFSLKSLLVVAFLAMNIVLAVAQTKSDIISSLEKEVGRNFEELKSKGSPSPFFISYAIIDQYQMLVKASLGTVVQSEEDQTGWGMPISLYVGSYMINNEKMDDYTHSSAIHKVSLDTDAADFGISIKDALENRYKVAVRAYEKKKRILNRATEEDALLDFEKTPAVDLILPPEVINTNREYWETYASAASAVADKYPEIVKSDVTVDLRNAMAYYYNTEGSRFAVPSVYCTISFVAQLIAEDGATLQEHISIIRSSTDRLPDIETFVAECEKKIIYLLELKNAPVADKSYTGPVLCEEEALMNLIGFSFFNNAMTVHHRDLDANYNIRLITLEPETGKRIISNQLTVKSLSGTKMYKGEILDGYLPMDSEGVAPAEELILIENGILKNMLSSRTPSVKNPHSNGHSRFVLNSAFPYFGGSGAPGRSTSPGVIHFMAKNTTTETDLKKKLIELARKAGLEYAYIVKSSSNNGAIRIYVEDGREELVRGLYNPRHGYKKFDKISGASDEEYISTNWGIDLVSSYIFPKAILFDELEIPKKDITNSQIDF